MATGRNPGLGARLVVGLIGATIVVASPLGVRIAASVYGLPQEAQAFEIGTFVTLIGAWAMAVFLTAYMEEDHILKSLLTSLGIPGVVVSLSIGFQAIR